MHVYISPLNDNVINAVIKRNDQAAKFMILDKLLYFKFSNMYMKLSITNEKDLKKPKRSNHKVTINIVLR